MKTLAISTALACMVGGAVVAYIGEQTFSSPKEERRFLVYAIARDLRLGMARAEVAAVIERHRAPYLDLSEEPGVVRVRVNISSARSCQLTLGFSDERLTYMRIRGENGPDDRFPDAPADMGSNTWLGVSRPQVVAAQRGP
jgi:hypothetical protein